MKLRTLKELGNDPIVDDMCVKRDTICIWDESLITIFIPKTKSNIWMYKHISIVIKDFVNMRLNYYDNHTTHHSKIDLYRAIHKDLKKQLRNMYKYYPVEFGYALKAPCDMNDIRLAERVAIERLIRKIKGAV